MQNVVTEEKFKVVVAEGLALIEAVEHHHTERWTITVVHLIVVRIQLCAVYEDDIQHLEYVVASVKCISFVDPGVTWPL